MYTVLLLIFLIPSSSQSSEKKLLDHLVAGSSIFVLPVLNKSTSVIVKFGFELIHITSVMESDQNISIKVWLRMSWLNELMKWDPREWGNITSSRLNYESVWTPDIYLQEDISRSMSTGPEKYKTLINVHSNGRHTWFVPVLYRSSFAVDVKNFPFDQQTCALIFTSWTHDQSEIKIEADTRPMTTTSYLDSTEWQLTNISREVRSISYGCCPNPFADIKFTIILRRKSLYYIYNVILPCIIQMFIILSTFFLPPDSGERIGVVITVMLVFAVYLEVLSQSLPKASRSTPVLSRFYFSAMFSTAVSIIASSVVLTIHFQATGKGIPPMPLWVRTLFIDKVAKCFLVRKNLREYDDKLLARKSLDTDTRHDTRQDTSRDTRHDERHHAKNDTRPYTRIHGNEKLNVKENALKIEQRVNNRGTLEELIRQVSMITSTFDNVKKHDEIEEEWKILAKVVDRLFFLIFFVIFLVSSLAILLPGCNLHTSIKYKER